MRQSQPRGGDSRAGRAVTSRFFYGWVILLVAGLCYGFGMPPVYYSWGIFAPRITAELGIDRAAVGGVFGLFNTLHQCVGLLVGLAIARFGLRRVMPAGFCVTDLSGNTRIQALPPRLT